MNLGLHTTLDDQNSILDPEVIAISETISPLKAKEFGRVWDLFQTKDKPFVTDEFEVLQRQYTSPVADTEAWDASAVSGLGINASHINRITVGDVLLNEDEVVVVKSVNRTANTIDVYERGAGESTASSHSAGTAKIIGNAHREGRVDGEAMAEETIKYTNYLQLVEEVVDLTYADSEQARKTGVTDITLKTEALDRVMRDLARTAIYGVAVKNTATKPATTRGLLNWLQLSGALVDNVGGEFTQTALDGILNDIRMQGGNPNVIVMSVKNKLKFNSFTSADQVKQDVGDKFAGRVLEVYMADGFGGIPVYVDIDMPDDTIAVVDTTKLKKGWKMNDALRFVPETNTNSRERKETLQGKFGLAVENVGQSHGLLTGITTS